LKRIRSGVEIPEGKEGVDGVRREDVECEGEGFGLDVNEETAGERSLEEVGVGREEEVPMVVLCWRLVVSGEGGGGRFEWIEEGDTIDARQRKHSPVPK
jgi:hypothetical protein